MAGQEVSWPAGEYLVTGFISAKMGHTLALYDSDYTTREAILNATMQGSIPIVVKFRSKGSQYVYTTAEGLRLVKSDTTTKGQKFDKGKRDYTLMPWGALDSVLDVLQFGAEKYSKDNWQKVDPSRYRKALLRHVIAYAKGERIDSDSGLPTMAHAACCCLFILHNHDQPQKEDDNGNS